MPAYNATMVTTLIRQWIDDAPRGVQSQLARAIGVGPQAVNKWYRGHTCPEPDKWSVIEAFFGQPDDTLAEASGYHRRVAGATAPPAGKITHITAHPGSGKSNSLSLPADLHGKIGTLTPDELDRLRAYVDGLIDGRRT